MYLPNSDGLLLGVETATYLQFSHGKFSFAANRVYNVWVSFRGNSNQS